MSDELKKCPFCADATDLFNAGFNAARNGEPALPPELEFTNAWMEGYAYGAYEPMKKRIAELDKLLKEATEAIGAVMFCCTYSSAEEAKSAPYGISHKAGTRITEFLCHYKEAIADGRVSLPEDERLDMEVKRE